MSDDAEDQPLEGNMIEIVVHMNGVNTANGEISADTLRSFWERISSVPPVFRDGVQCSMLKTAVKMMAGEGMDEIEDPTGQRQAEVMAQMMGFLMLEILNSKSLPPETVSHIELEITHDADFVFYDASMKCKLWAEH